MSLTAAEILALEDRVIESVDVPEWGEGKCVFVRSISTGEAIQLNADIQAADSDTGLIMTAQLAAFLCDESGTPLFADCASAAGLMKRKPKIVNRIVRAGQRLNNAESQDDVKAK